MSRLDDLYARHLQPLTKKLIGFGQSEQDAEDIAQETLIATWKRLDHVAPEAEWRYLVVAAFNLARKLATRRRPLTSLEATPDASDETSSAEQTLIERQETEQFQTRFLAVMRELTPETQQAIFLRAQGLRSKEIASKLGLTDQAVRSRLSRAFELIRARAGEPPADVRWMSLFGDHDDHEK
ncbi:MAG TPA: RNA polymerase sigma factor [Thermoanaerobaculia bacterium]